ncbi:hypothetical protein CEE45_03465 [Candidatus Heimdallarchaeota archaeon B3_Heim]|nr:MAG: hypothetical protein CEE45_03465 [Candidatus Heimdallarchaeota archaeon B3_Heim]
MILINETIKEFEAEQKCAIIVYTAEYEKDYLKLSDTLSNSDIGGYQQVFPIKFENGTQLTKSLINVFQGFRDGKLKNPHLIVFYFSCHGVRGSGTYFLSTKATPESQHDKLRFLVINDLLDESCKVYKQVLLIDSCFSNLTKGEMSIRNSHVPVPTTNDLTGRGRFTICSSDSYQISEHDPSKKTSVFTDVLVDALTSGEADENEDGIVTAEELRRTLSMRVKKKYDQKSISWDCDREGVIYLAKNPNYLEIPLQLKTLIRPLAWIFTEDYLNQQQIEKIPMAFEINDLVRPISETEEPDSWYSIWCEHWEQKDWKTHKRWINNRITYFLSGTRGLTTSCLSDILLMVPPLERSVTPLYEQLMDEQRTAIFAPSGTGKSRKMLFLAAWWKKNHRQGDIFICSSPQELTHHDWADLVRLSEERTTKRNRPVLYIFDDLHHNSTEVHLQVKSLLENRKSMNLFLLGGYTTTIYDDTTKLKKIRRDWTGITSSRIDANQEWRDWKPFFQKWSEWVTKVKGGEITAKIKPHEWDSITSPWEVAVILGDTVKKIKEYFAETTDSNVCQKFIYWLLAALFLLTGEKAVAVSEVVHVLVHSTDGFQNLLKRVFALSEIGNITEELLILFKSWECPTEEGFRLIPPRPVYDLEMDEETVDFFHQRLADDLLKTDDKIKHLLVKCFEQAYEGFKEATHAWGFISSWKTLSYWIKIENKHIIEMSLNDIPYKIDNREWRDNLEWIGNLKRLERLDLRSNYLSALPESIGNLKRLERLDLDGNRLSALPESIGNLKRLEHLDLRNDRFYDNESVGNQLSALPESIGNLQRLKTLDLKGNQLSTLPESIGDLQQLRTLVLGYNQFSTLPESIGDLKELRTLDLGGNQLSTLPESIGDLRQLLINCNIIL